LLEELEAYDGLSPAHLCREVKKGDPIALHQLSKRFSKYVGRVIWRPNRDWMTKQQTIVAAWETLQLFQRTLEQEKTDEQITEITEESLQRLLEEHAEGTAIQRKRLHDVGRI
jgi:hypothetical protein